MQVFVHEPPGFLVSPFFFFFKRYDHGFVWEKQNQPFLESPISYTSCHCFRRKLSRIVSFEKKHLRRPHSSITAVGPRQAELGSALPVITCRARGFNVDSFGGERSRREGDVSHTCRCTPSIILNPSCASLVFRSHPHCQCTPRIFSHFIEKLHNKFLRLQTSAASTETKQIKQVRQQMSERSDYKPITGKSGIHGSSSVIPESPLEPFFQGKPLT